MMVRAVLDTVIYNRAVEHPQFGKNLKFACQFGYLKLISTHVQRDQLLATPDAKKREDLLSIFNATSPELTPKAAMVWNVTKWDQAEFPDEERIAFFKKTLGELPKATPVTPVMRSWLSPPLPVQVCS